MAFTLDAVLDLGGEKDDFEELRAVDDDSEEMELDVDDNAHVTEDDAPKLEDLEIKRFLKKLGFSKLDKTKTRKREENNEAVERDKKQSKEKKRKQSSLVREDGRVEDKVSQLQSISGDYGVDGGGKEAEKQLQFVQQSASKHPLDTGLLEQLETSAAKPAMRLLVVSGGHWFENVPDLPPDVGVRPDDESTARCDKIGAMLLERDSMIYKQKKESQKSSDAQWLKTVLTSGTLSDKLAALVLQIQESPEHQLSCLDMLLRMMKKKSKREALMALDAVRQLWLTDLLPEVRRLKPLSQRPLAYLSTIAQSSGSEARDRLLLYWHFEDQLHKRCGQVIEALQILIHDVEENVRKKTLGLVYDLLSSKPEQEKELLSMLVNKLGDPTRQVSSKAAYLLLKLVSSHPNMKLVVMCEVEKLLYRPKVSGKAQYCAICFLNQLILTQRESQLASRLIDIYFSFFKLYTKKGSVETRMLGALLCGVNRAFPFAKIDDDGVFQEHLNTLFHVVHAGTFNTSVQALMLLYQVMESRKSVSDRFYQALYEKLLDPGLRASSKHAMFLNVLFKALKSDPSRNRVMAFVKRLLQVCFYQHADFSCAMLYLVSEMERIRPYLLDKLLAQNEESTDEESFKDIDEGNRAVSVGNSQFPNCLGGHYMPRNRNPLYAGAEHTSLWELQKLTCHFHPSVSRFSNDLLQTSCIEYESNPLQDFTLIRFLDRFVYKNPKKTENDRGGSLMQPKLKSVRLMDKPVNTKKFLSQSESNVREDELFFYKYFTSTARHHKVTEEKEMPDVEANDAEVTSVDFARALRKSKTDRKQRPSVTAGNESSDEDDGGADLSDDDMLLENKMTDQDYEKLLLENMSSEEEEDDAVGQASEGHKRERHHAQDGGTDSIFASAEEFAHLLEENQSLSAGSSDAVKTKAGESVKQLQWERERSSDWKWRKQTRKRPFSDRDQPHRRTSKKAKSSRPLKMTGKSVRGRKRVRRKGGRA